MKVGIIGSGVVGRALGAGLIRAGHTVMLGTRRVGKEEVQNWLAEYSAGGHAGSFSQAAAFGDALVLCTSWVGTKHAIESAGVWNFKNKLVIDVTNPLDGKGPDKAGRLTLAPGNAASGGEQVQAWLQEAHVVKALNSIGYAHMVKPDFEDGEATMLLAGNDTLAKKAVEDLLHQLGWKDVVDIGDIEMSRGLEAMCVVWCAYGFRTGKWHHAFRLMRR